MAIFISLSASFIFICFAQLFIDHMLSLCTLDINPLWVPCVTNIFWCVAHPFFLMMVSFGEPKILIFTEAKRTIISYKVYTPLSMEIIPFLGGMWIFSYFLYFLHSGCHLLAGSHPGGSHQRVLSHLKLNVPRPWISTFSAAGSLTCIQPTGPWADLYTGLATKSVWCFSVRGLWQHVVVFNFIWSTFVRLYCDSCDVNVHFF